MRVIEHSEVKEQAGLLRPTTHCVRTSGADVPMLLFGQCGSRSTAWALLGPRQRDGLKRDGCISRSAPLNHVDRLCPKMVCTRAVIGSSETLY
jgi:hypothetical protein